MDRFKHVSSGLCSLLNVTLQTVSSFVIICGLLLIQGCAGSWQIPEDAGDEALRARAVKATDRGIDLKAAVLSSADSRRIFGSSVNETGVQPVWIEVENHSTHTVWLLRSGTDPNYYSPLEVAWSLHEPFAGKTNAEMDEYFKHISFEGAVSPGQTRSGIIFTNQHTDIKILNVDLLGQRSIFPFTLFLPIPDDNAKHPSELKAFYKSLQTVNYRNENAFRNALEQLTCCAAQVNSTALGEPVNMVLVGKLEDIASALIRSGYRQQMTESDLTQRLFDRAPEHVLRKEGRGGTPSNWLRIWMAPIRYQDQPVFLVQTGRPVGGRFVNAETEQFQLHPDIDEARNLFIQDMLYSGGLAKLGFVKGSGKIERGTDHQLYEPGFYTDGLRAVLFFVTRPLTLSDVQILDWEPLLQQREAEVFVR